MPRLTRHDRKRRGLKAAGSDVGAGYRLGYKGNEHPHRRRQLATDGDPQSMASLAPDFVEWMRARNFSPVTLKSCQLNLDHFLVWCGERGLSRPYEVTLAILERYQRWLYHQRTRKGSPLAFRTQQGRLGAVRSFFSYLTRTHRILSNPAADLLLPRQMAKLPQDVMSVAEAERVLAVPDVNDALGLRDRAILETFYSTGIRRTELANLQLYHLDRERSLLKIVAGKGGKDRVVPIGERALHWISRYLTEVRPQLVVEPDPQSLFLNLCGEPLSPEMIAIVARKCVKESGISKKGACHLFRHTCATLMLEGGADIRFIQEMLGHKHLDTTEIYTRVSPQKLQAIHAASHPGARLKSTRPVRDSDDSGEVDEPRESGE